MSLDDDALYRIIGHRLRHARDAQRLSQARLAKLAGLKRTSITNIEAGRQRLPIYLLYHLAVCLEVQPHELLPWLDEVRVDQLESPTVPAGLPPRSARVFAAITEEGLDKSEAP